jgi:kynureninase
MSSLDFIAHCQVDRARRVRDRATTELQLLLHRAMSPDDVRKALLKESPVLEALRRLDLAGPDPHELRAEAAAVGAIDATAADLAYRRLFPGLDLGVYLANHAVGKPSVVAQAALDQFHAQHTVFGVDAFVEAGWLDLVDDLRFLIGELAGDPGLRRGDVAWFPNLSDALSAVLAGLGGRLVTTAGHFTTGHYIHERWAARSGGSVVVVPQDPSECVPTERVIAALTPDTTVVSLSQVHWRSGYVHDLAAITTAITDLCPGAALLLDVYQGHGTVPIPPGSLPERAAVLGGGLKQLHSGTGAGYAWVSTALLADVQTERVGWFAHADPLAFEPPPLRPGEGAAALRTGTPALLPLVLLATELKVLAASADGTLTSGVARARRITRDLVARAADRCEELGLTVRGPSDPERRGAFLAVEVDDGLATVTALRERGVSVDFRADGAGRSGIVRLSASAAQFGYELDYGVRALAAACAR